MIELRSPYDYALNPMNNLIAYLSYFKNGDNPDISNNI
jgi:hypothetical protein